MAIERSYFCRTEEVERLLIAKGMSMQLLARKSRITEKTIRRMFKGHRLRLETIQMLAHALGATCETLVDDRRGAETWLRETPSRFSLRLRLTGRFRSRLQECYLNELAPKIISWLDSEGISVTGRSATLATRPTKRTAGFAYQQEISCRPSRRPKEVQRVFRYIVAAPAICAMKHSWFVAAIDPDKFNLFVNSPHAFAYEFRYGEIINSGWGKAVPRNVLKRASEQLNVPISRIINLTAKVK